MIREYNNVVQKIEKQKVKVISCCSMERKLEKEAEITETESL